LDRLLRNVAYVGQVRYQNEVHPGEHSALVSACDNRDIHRLNLMLTLIPNSAVCRQTRDCHTSSASVCT
jgi:hypothetical protein